MEELIRALTRAANAVAVYYERENATYVGSVPAADAQVAAEIAVKKLRKARTPKAESALIPPAERPAVVEAAVKAAAASAPMTEAESEAKLKVVGEAFVQRFAKNGDAVDEVKKIIESKFKVVRLRDLVHAQRVELISILEARIREIDSKPTQAAPVAAVGLGL